MVLFKNRLFSHCCAHAPNCPGKSRVGVILVRLILRGIFNTLHIRTEVVLFKNSFHLFRFRSIMSLISDFCVSIRQKMHQEKKLQCEQSYHKTLSLAEWCC